MLARTVRQCKRGFTGTDSRLGFGFRLGPHADFQVLVELGPQNSTSPIGPDAAPPAKRQTLTMENPQKLAEYINKFSLTPTTSSKKQKKRKETVSDSPGGKWIDQWRNTLFGQGQIGKIQFNKVPGIDDLSAEGSERVDMMWTDPTQHHNNMVNHLRQLYKAQPNPS